MDALSQIRAKINDYQGYGSETDIARSDETVRAYAGERLAELAGRLSPEDPQAPDTLAPLIQRAAFANQRILAQLEVPKMEPPAQTGILQADATLLDLADAAASVDDTQLNDYTGKVSAAFDARDAALLQLRGKL